MILKNEIWNYIMSLKNLSLNTKKCLRLLSNLVDEDGNIVIDGGNFNDESEEDLKENTFKFINISMVVNIKRVAEHLGISEEEAYDLLVEILRYDEFIS